MTDNIEAQIPEIAPVLTNDQKLAIRETQVSVLKSREQARQLQDKASQLEYQIAQFINKTAADLKVDPKVYSFDIETLNFYKTPVQ